MSDETTTDVHAERHRLADLLDKRAADAGAHCLNVILAGEGAKIIGNFEGRACAFALAASIARTGHDFANLPSADTKPDLAARLLAASEAAARAEQRALFAEGDAATMRRERDALRQAMRDLAEQIREAENVPRSPLARTMWTNHGPDADVLCADAVADAILAAIGGAE
jgi:hypothetical protein